METFVSILIQLRYKSMLLIGKDEKKPRDGFRSDETATDSKEKGMGEGEKPPEQMEGNVSDTQIPVEAATNQTNEGKGDQKVEDENENDEAENETIKNGNPDENVANVEKEAVGSLESKMKKSGDCVDASNALLNKEDPASHVETKADAHESQRKKEEDRRQ
jgi:hypothetical protein